MATKRSMLVNILFLIREKKKETLLQPPGFIKNESEQQRYQKYKEQYYNLYTFKTTTKFEG